jgi:hypothetical protein
MATALNLTIPLKQDDQTQESVRALVDSFTENYQEMIDAALARSRIVHSARILVIDNKYLQVLTEFDGDPIDYTDFFREELGSVFEKIFALAEGAPPWEELNNRAAFYEYTHKRNVKALGTSTVDNEGRGYLFSAMGDKTVRELQAALGQNGSDPAQAAAQPHVIGPS